MPEGQVLEFDRVTKRFGDVTAVSEFSGRVEPGVVTGFLGPNGAGKTTTLRMLLGMLRPSSGSATVGGAHYAELKHAARVIGAMPEDPGFRPRRTVERHLITTAKANGIPLARVGEVIRFVGLDSEAESRIATLSLGMRQRLSAATALLGDPGALVLDEPANGLDPEGIRWMRLLIRGLADEGRTVLVSSHVLSEVEQVADEILVIARGQRKFAGSLATLADPTTGPVVVDALDRDALEAALAAAGFEFEVLRSGLTVRGSDAATIGSLAASAGVALTTLQQRGPTLEDVFLDLVNDRPVQFRTPEPAPDAPVPLADAEVAAEPVAADEVAVDRQLQIEEQAAVDEQDEVDEQATVGTAPAEDPAADPSDAGARFAASGTPVADLSTPLPTSVIEIPSLVEDTADAVDETLVVDEIPAAFAPVSVAAAAATPSAEEPSTDDPASETAFRDDRQAEHAPGEPQEARSLPGLAGLAAAAIGITTPAVADEQLVGEETVSGDGSFGEDPAEESDAGGEADDKDAADAPDGSDAPEGSAAADPADGTALPSWSPVPSWMPAAQPPAEGASDDAPVATASDDPAAQGAEPASDDAGADVPRIAGPMGDAAEGEFSEASEENAADEAEDFFSAFRKKDEQPSDDDRS